MDLSKAQQPVGGKAEVSLFVAQRSPLEADMLIE